MVATIACTAAAAFTVTLATLRKGEISPNAKPATAAGANLD